LNTLVIGKKKKFEKKSEHRIKNMYDGWDGKKNDGVSLAAKIEKEESVMDAKRK